MKKKKNYTLLYEADNNYKKKTFKECFTFLFVVTEWTVVKIQSWTSPQTFMV